MAAKYFIFKFADVEVREREYALVKAGEVTPVEPKAFRVLLILLRNPQKLIAKEELLNAVWGDAAVTENSLTRAIALLRRLLGDERSDPRFIETVATVGYRFLCPVQVTEDLSAIPSPPMRQSLAESAPSVGTGIASTAQHPATAIRGPRWTWVLTGAAVFALIALALAAYTFVHFRAKTPDPFRVKMQFAPPQLAEFLSSLGLSPDGRFLNYLTCEAFTCKIWIRPLDSLEPRMLGDGSRGLVFWSPDSKYLAFQSAGKLYKIEPKGGAPIFLANAPVGLVHYTGGVWLDGGVIVLTADDSIYTVPGSGGTPARLSSDAALNASWLPGAQFLYSNDHGVFASSIRGDKPVQVLPDGVRAIYVPPARTGLRGHLVFTRAGTLFAQEFDIADPS
jgi:DNA-binding winged helix-turn-helix (wHTH) protein